MTHQAQSMSKNTRLLAQQLGDILRAKGWQLTCAESCTGGGIGYAITEISGSSNWFDRGFITYSNQAKQAMLGVSAATLECYGAVSAQTVEAMAAGAAKAAGAQCAIAVSGIAGPDGGSADKPVGTVWFAFALEQQLFAEKQMFSGARDQVRQQAIDYALSRMIQLTDT
ncbi:MAG: nicotinamide-nucleotide amidase [Paraglaciecola sp.]|jgi:nicotinamide-nucleotide amidase